MVRFAQPVVPKGRGRLAAVAAAVAPSCDNQIDSRQHGQAGSR